MNYSVTPKMQTKQKLEWRRTAVARYRIRRAKNAELNRIRYHALKNGGET
jgi:hypothetical protein